MFSRKFRKDGPVWLLIIFCLSVTLLVIFKKEKQEDMVDVREVFPNEAAATREFEHDVLEDQMRQKMKDPVNSPAIISSPTQEGQTPFVVQAYSFQNKTRAEATVSILKSQGYPAYVLMSDLGEKGIWYRVRIGDFNTQTEAEKIIEQLKKDAHSGFITRK